MVLACVMVGGWIAEEPDLPGREPVPALDIEESRQFIKVLPTSMPADSDA